jgi:hypothetical protein
MPFVKGRNPLLWRGKGEANEKLALTKRHWIKRVFFAFGFAV